MPLYRLCHHLGETRRARLTLWGIACLLSSLILLLSLLSLPARFFLFRVFFLLTLRTRHSTPTFHSLLAIPLSSPLSSLSLLLLPNLFLPSSFLFHLIPLDSPHIPLYFLTSSLLISCSVSSSFSHVLASSSFTASSSFLLCFTAHFTSYQFASSNSLFLTSAPTHTLYHHDLEFPPSPRLASPLPTLFLDRNLHTITDSLSGTHPRPSFSFYGWVRKEIFGTHGDRWQSAHTRILSTFFWFGESKCLG